MDWPAIIENHRQALKSVLAGLVALAACFDRGPTLPRHLHLAMLRLLRLLRPAESAVRRLVILTARRLPTVPLPPPRLRKPIPPPAPRPKGVVVNLGLAMPPPLTPPHKGEGDLARGGSPSPVWGAEGWARPVARPGEGGDGSTDAPLSGCESPRPPAFPLLDPLRRVRLDRRPVRTSVPRISVPGYSAPRPIVQRRDDAVAATRLGRRLAALGSALENLPAQARRFLRWQARNAMARAAGQRRRIGPLRSGRPPGQHRRRTHEVHHLLAKLHDYAFFALECRDTS
jgi:hypothetical protein